MSTDGTIPFNGNYEEFGADILTPPTSTSDEINDYVQTAKLILYPSHLVQNAIAFDASTSISRSLFRKRNFAPSKPMKTSQLLDLVPFHQRPLLT